MIQALTHSDRDIYPDERIVQLSHVILGSWSAVRQMALQTSRARWCKPLNLAALPSHAESPSVLLPRHQSSVSQVSVSQVPAQASFTLRLLLSTSLLLRTAGTHAQNRQGSQGDQLRHLQLRAIRMFLRARERAAHLVLAALAVAQHAAEHGSVLPDVAPSTSGCPFSRGLCSTWCPCESRATTTASTG